MDENVVIVLETIDEFTILAMQKRQIKEIIKSSKKFTSPADFLKSAIEILLAWESKHPEDCLQIINSLRPWTPEQEAQIARSMKPEEIKRNFGVLDLEQNKEETYEQRALAQTNYDHMKLQGNYSNIIKYIKTIKISKTENIIPYDGYPLLSTNYSRFLPIKLTILMFAHMLESKKETKIELKDLRVNAYDLLEEYGIMIKKYEKLNGITRQNKISTGLPKKYSDDEEKSIEMKIRIKDIQIGKIRTSRKLEGTHFDGALSALGLVYAFEEEGKTFVSLTELGKKFILLENPIFPTNDFSKGSLSETESNFILNELITQRELEKNIIDKIFITTRGIQEPINENDDDSYAENRLEELETNIHEEIKKYIEKNPKIGTKFNLNELKTSNPKTKQKIKQIRLAVMGRLVELGKIKWKISSNSVSKYYLDRS